MLKELLKLDLKKTSVSDGLDPFFKVAAPIIAKPISNLFNLSLLSGEVPIAWKAATGFRAVYSILSGMQSGFHSGYGCVTATLTS